ncbi:MAG: PorV/PorQ family protein [Candidatus Zixiibacteriota bacterium]
MKKTAIFISLLLLIGPSVIKAETQGGFAGSFLNMPVDARTAAMGGAFNAVSDDGAAVLYNPAGIQTMTDRVFTSSYRAMKMDRKLGFVSLILPTHGESSLGFSWVYAGYGEVDKRNINGQLTGETISSNEHDFAVSFAKRFLPYLAIGTRLNYYTKSLGDLNASSVGVNIGGLLYVDSLFRYGEMEDKIITDITAGLVMKNLAAKYPWESQGTGLAATQSDKFPVSLGIGASCKTLKRKLLIASDLEIQVKTVEWDASSSEGTISNKETYTDSFFRIGGEYKAMDNLMIRTGLNNGVFTAGAGFVFVFSSSTLQFNYAFSGDKADEGEDHVITLGIRF